MKRKFILAPIYCAWYARQTHNVEYSTNRTINCKNMWHCWAAKTLCKWQHCPINDRNSFQKQCLQFTWGKNSNRPIASGYEMNAKPAPPLTTCPTSAVPVTWAKWPKIPNIVKPANIDVNVSRVVTIVASRYTLCSNRLKDAYIIKFPKQTANEKKHCVMAAYQTCNELDYVVNSIHFTIRP